MAILGQNKAFLVGVTVSFEVEGRMIAQNGILDESDLPRPEKFFSLS